MVEQAEIGIFGGSGFYSFADGAVREIKVETPYGPPSDTIALATVAGRKVAFLPRHGRTHSLPPHKIPYRANLWAFKELGVKRVFAPNAVGSLQAHIAPGDFLIADQFVDRTTGRDDTYYDGPFATHVSTADPYCAELRALAGDTAEVLNIPAHREGTCVVIQGPRFSTKAESRWFTQMGWHVVNMTQYPEAALARELAMCYVNISLITDFDAGVVSEHGPVQAVDVAKVLKQNTENVKRLILRMLETMPATSTCDCADALKYARLD